MLFVMRVIVCACDCRNWDIVANPAAECWSCSVVQHYAAIHARYLMLVCKYAKSTEKGEN